MNNVQKLTEAGLIVSGSLPSPEDQATINNLNPTEVDGLIHIWRTVGSDFLTRNCIPGGTAGPEVAARIIGIVF